MVYIKIIFRNLSYEGSSGDEEEERETEYSGAAWNLQKYTGSPGPKELTTKSSL